MKITKHQLRRIIKEEFGGHARPPRGVGGVSQALIDDYNSWVHKSGHITPAASSVMASYFVEHGMEEDHDAHQMMADFFSLEHEDVMRDINRQQSERSATMGEGTEIGNMPDSWRQILGDCLGDK